MQMIGKEIHSIKTIVQQYHTGEEPVLVVCSDRESYVCKYMRSSSASYKLVCELIGSCMAVAWNIVTPRVCLVKIKAEHWPNSIKGYRGSAPSLGTAWLENVVDITPSTCNEIPKSTCLLEQLLKIALFDFWIANEDRNANNANLMYDLQKDQIVSIDYGCIFNTATFDYPLSQLTMTDTILWSDLFKHLTKDVARLETDRLVKNLKNDYSALLERSKAQMQTIMDVLPEEWLVPPSAVKEKMNQLFVSEWTDGVWENFTDCLAENL